jgi:hypothetical protein
VSRRHLRPTWGGGLDADFTLLGTAAVEFVGWRSCTWAEDLRSQALGPSAYRLSLLRSTVSSIIAFGVWKLLV